MESDLRSCFFCAFRRFLRCPLVFFCGVSIVFFVGFLLRFWEIFHGAILFLGCGDEKMACACGCFNENNYLCMKYFRRI